MLTKEEWLQVFRRLEEGSSLRQEAKKLGIGKSTVERRFQTYIEQRTNALRSGLTELMNEVSDAKGKLVGLAEKYEKRKQEEEAKLREALAKRERENKLRVERIDAELEAKKKLLPECARQGMSFKECLDAVKKIGDLGVEFSRRKRLLKQWGEAIEKKQRQHDELEQRIPKLEESEKGGKYALQAVQKLYWDTVDKIQAINQQLYVLEQEINERFGMVLVLRDEEARARVDAENAMNMLRENTDQLAEIQEAALNAKKELKQAEVTRDSMLAGVENWIAKAANARVDEAAEILRVRLMSLGVQMEKPVEASG